MIQYKEKIGDLLIKSITRQDNKYNDQQQQQQPSLIPLSGVGTWIK
jgi:hypothetical protein